MIKHSKQRDAILDYLHSTKSHPTAETVYENVREHIPNISLGTVYRNLAALSDSGDILGITVGDGSEHFDGDKRPHIHLHCRKCGNIADAPLTSDAPIKAASKAGFVPDSEVYVVCGVCAECNKL